MSGPFLTLLLAPAVLPGGVEIDGFGTVELPHGPWVLERTHLPAGRGGGARVVIFRRPGGATERFTVVHYPPPNRVAWPWFYCDNVLDSTPYGVPRFVLGGEERDAEERARTPGELADEPGSAHLDFFEPRHATSAEREAADRVGLTCLHPRASVDRPNWMCHAIVAKAKATRGRAGGVFVLVHSGERVLLPEAVADVPLPRPE